MELLIIHLLNMVVLWAILGLSLNILQGTAGLFNLGHAAFFAVGAYASALLSKAGLPWFVCLMAAAAFPALLALSYGLPSLRLKADYFATVTMGIGEIARHVLNNWQDVTGGPNGVTRIPNINLFGLEIKQGPGTLIVGTALFLLLLWALERWRCSGFGQVLKAGREDADAAKALGKDIYLSRLWCFLISAAVAGVAGSLFAHYYGYISPSDFGLWVSFNLILIVMIGGSGNYLATLPVALIFVLLRDGMRFLPLPAAAQGPLQQFLYGALLIIITLRFPHGLMREKPTVVAPLPTNEQEA
jgi:branched-chain amino acid transport system permease protein